MLDEALRTCLDLLVLGTEVLLVRFSIEYFFGYEHLLLICLDMNSVRRRTDRTFVHEVSVRTVHDLFLSDSERV